ncbi:acyl-CoA dehydrogenase [Streptomyces sp. CB02923]|uniref:acyl-CoA dehydrogenase family protein n=1 Tax=Streptomyces sp. CB02923 TaxID=1718985 RepID=UPI000939E060|nr:acyl-CoA dehydrogenase family protein [Streptomyces sp. CB02923]OKI03438.1 acyl-CoA dehydrogenase [Streptomyces sp. CB02923]
MDLRPTADQRALQSGTRELLARRFGRDRLRAAVEHPALDRALWRELGAAGFFALRLPEADGGVGLGLPEAVLVFEEAGRALLPGPLVAGQLLAGVVPGVAEGERVVGLCEVGSYGMGPYEMGAYEVGAGGGGLWEHPGDCDELILIEGGVAGGPGADAYGGVSGAAYGDACGRAYWNDPGWPVQEPVCSIDPLTPLARVTSYPRRAPRSLDVPRLRREAALLTAALQLGSAARTVEMAVEHAGRREQFGVRIGSFQAVKHLCAEMLIRVEIARSAVYAASLVDQSLAVVGAKLLADEAAVRNARDCLQVHGGMGFTWEADVHLHLKRAWLRVEQWQSRPNAEEVLAEALLTGNVGV